MSVSLDTAGAIVFKSSSAVAAGSYPVTLSAPTSVAAARAISMYDPIGDSALSFGRQRVIAVADAGTRTMTSAESGSLVSINGTNAVVINLPAPSAGLKYDFMMAIKNPATQDIPITATGALLNGHIIGAATAVACVAKTTINFVKAVAEAGSIVKVISDGTSWALDAKASTAASFTVA